MIRSLPPALLVGSLLLAGCGPGEPAADADPLAEPATRATEPAAAPAAGAAEAGERGSGTLRLGDVTYEFAVRACDLDGEADDAYHTISGRGATPDGEPFDVFVSRNEAGGMLTHSISLQTGDVRAGTGTEIEAHRMRHGDSWMSVRGGPAEPLIRIDGDRVTAAGQFGPADDGMAEGQPGVLEATCR